MPEAELSGHDTGGALPNGVGRLTTIVLRKKISTYVYLIFNLLGGAGFFVLSFYFFYQSVIPCWAEGKCDAVPDIPMVGRSAAPAALLAILLFWAYITFATLQRFRGPDGWVKLDDRS